MDTERAKNLLLEQIEATRKLAGVGETSPEFQKWRRDAEVTINRIFGGASRHLSDFSKISFSPGIYYSGMPDDADITACRRGIDEACMILLSMVEEIEKFGIEGVPGIGDKQNISSGKRVFISHCHGDSTLADKIVELLQTALIISREEIHCTSVPGCEAEPGSDIIGVSVEEARKASKFVLLLTRQSLLSKYVWVEVGARLGASGKILPVAIDNSICNSAGPIQGQLALQASLRKDMIRLVEEIAKPDRPRESHSAYDTKIDDVVATAKRIAETSAPSPAHSAFSPATDGAYHIISLISGLCIAFDRRKKIIVQKPFKTDGDQRWRFESTGHGLFKIISVSSSGRCLTANHATEDVTLVQFANSEGQRWKIEGGGCGSVIICSEDMKACLDVLGGRTEVGTTIIRHRNVHRKENQQWILFPFQSNM